MGDETKQPTESAQTTPQVFESPPITKTKTKKTKAGLITGVVVGIFIVLVLGSALVFALISNLNNKPEKVLADAVSNLVTDTFSGIPVSSKGSFKVINKGDEEVTEITVNYEAKSEQDAIKAGGSAEFFADVSIKAEGKTFNLKGTMIYSKDKTFYIRLENVRAVITEVLASTNESAAVLRQIEPIITKIDNKWISITEEDIKELSGNERQVDSLSECSGALQSVEVSKSDQKEVKRIFKENPFFSVSENLNTEVVNGQDTFHYKLDTNDEQGEGFITAVGELESFKNVKEKCDDSGDDFSEGSSDETETKPIFELWVGKKDRRVSRIKVTGNDREVSVDLFAETKWDDDVVVEIPEDSTSIKTLREDIEGLLGSTR